MSEIKYKIYDEDMKKVVENKKIAIYTGLQDCRGTDIYEGDILEYDTGYRSVVKIDQGCFLSYSIHSDTYLYKAVRINKAIVVGSIYENPEMLNIRGKRRYSKYR